MGSQFDSASGPFKVLILGGCYSGLSAALNLIDLSEGRAARQGSGVLPGHDGKIPIEVTIVDERDGFYHLIGSPLALADAAYANKAWVKYNDIPALQNSKITIHQGTATAIDPAAKTATILDTTTQAPRHIPYDYLVVATGLRRAWPVVPQSLLKKTYLAESGAHIATVTAAPKGVVVVGGGAVGIEMAAELKLTQPSTRVTLVHSRARLLSSEPLPDECAERALELVREAGVELRMSTRLAETTTTTSATADGSETHLLRFEDGDTMEASVVIKAVSASVPSTEFVPAGVRDAEGYVLVRPNLMWPATKAGVPGGGDISVANADAHFAIGDVIRWSGIKRCGGAMHMGFFVAHNIHELILQRMTGVAPKFSQLSEVPPMIGLAVGKKAVSYGPAQGVESGEDVMKAFFGNDLGFDICWNYMKLGEKTGLPHGGPLEG
ncbi:unnamed protein product [Discula destructiva]